MTTGIAIVILALLFVVFGLFPPGGGERPSCHGCPDELEDPERCPTCPLLSGVSDRGKEVEFEP
ncbi:MAG: hypothetical protein R3326_02350 [Gemmatimonadota bacterium]|nr:hypothetical protein [Gemmatimonadota bacterium]